MAATLISILCLVLAAGLIRGKYHAKTCNEQPGMVNLTEIQQAFPGYFRTPEEQARFQNLKDFHPKRVLVKSTSTVYTCSFKSYCRGITTLTGKTPPPPCEQQPTQASSTPSPTSYRQTSRRESSPRTSRHKSSLSTPRSTSSHNNPEPTSPPKAPGLTSPPNSPGLTSPPKALGLTSPPNTPRRTSSPTTSSPSPSPNIPTSTTSPDAATVPPSPNTSTKSPQTGRRRRQVSDVSPCSLDYENRSGLTFHGCCISHSYTILPDYLDTAEPGQDGQVRIAQFHNLNQYFEIEECCQAQNCSGCQCAQTYYVTSAIVGRPHCNGGTVYDTEFVLVPGCCQCLNK